MVTFQYDIDKCIEVLSDGGIILYPTDTIWGIGCDATNTNAVNKIIKLKNREAVKSMIVLINDTKTILHYVSDLPENWLQILSTITTPTTIIYEKGRNLSSLLLHKGGSIAIRIVNDTFCKSLIETFGKPIVSTSANLSGEPTPIQYEEISNAIKNGVDYIVQHRRNEIMTSKPSNIIRIMKDGSMEILR